LFKKNEQDLLILIGIKLLKMKFLIACYIIIQSIIRNDDLNAYTVTVETYYTIVNKSNGWSCLDLQETYNYNWKMYWKISFHMYQIEKNIYIIIVYI
jgi:hypothetical protein